jgi:hypothetical protein
LSKRPDQAYDALRQAFEAGYPPRFAQDDPDLKALWKESRFTDLTRKHAASK